MVYNQIKAPLRLLLSAAFCSWLVLNTAIAQEGQYISISGTGQLTQLNNADDYATRTESLVPEDTYHPAAGLMYTYNFRPNYGFQTGINYSFQGQKYSGTLDDTARDIQYNSEVTLKYIKIPLKFRFNSSLDADIKNTYLSIGAGISINMLSGVDVNTDPPIRQTNGKDFNYSDLYKSPTADFVADALLNFRLSDKWWLHTGIDLSFGLGDVENKGYDFPDNSPLEWYFPVSTKKFNKPDIETREQTRNTVFGIEIGFAYRFTE